MIIIVVNILEQLRRDSGTGNDRHHWLVQRCSIIAVAVVVAVIHGEYPLARVIHHDRP